MASPQSSACANCGRPMPGNLGRCLYCGARRGRLCPACRSLCPVGATVCRFCARSIPDDVQDYVGGSIPDDVPDDVVGSAPPPDSTAPEPIERDAPGDGHGGRSVAVLAGVLLVAALAGVLTVARARGRRERSQDAPPPGAVRPWAKVGELQKRKAAEAGVPVARAVDLGGGVTLKMVYIPSGEFMMGSERGSGGGRPVHRVRITKGFYLGAYEVTQAQWQSVMGSNPSHFKGADRPVERVSWTDCQGFVRKLCAKEGVPEGTYRLPTEAEWEYACRAGSTTRFYFGDSDGDLDNHGWHRGNSGRQTHPVGEKTPNGFGLYDMHGNVWEWCSDWYDSGYYGKSPGADPPGPGSGSYRVNRGGGWLHSSGDCRSAGRSWDAPVGRYFSLGFRLARTCP